MTLIECFTESHIDNIAAALRLRPEKLVLVGDEQEMKIPVCRYRKLLQERGYPTAVSTCDVPRNDLFRICGALADLLRRDEDFVIDLTGGDETVIMAVGGVLAGLDEKKRSRIRVEKYDYGTDAVVDCAAGNRVLHCETVGLTVKELVELHGGVLYPVSYQPPAGSTCREIDGLWQVVAEAPKEWNDMLAKLSWFESRNQCKSKTRITVPLGNLRGAPGFEEKERIARQLLERLDRRGVIEDRSSRDVLDYTYASELLRYCTRKAGNALEVKTLLEGREAAPFFNDCMMSVSIDWDGVPHSLSEQKPDTRNEIDVVLMHGLVPLFISCKNGNIEDVELYKLHTVAERFGGPHAKKMLVATALDRNSDLADQAFVRRAWDMDVYPMTEAGKLTREKWEQGLKDAAR